MKKSILALIVSVLSFASLAMAQNLVPEIIYPEEANPEGSKISLVRQLPAGEWPTIVAGIVQLALGITGSLAFIAFTVGGVMFVTAQGSEEKISKAKTIIFWSLLALVAIAGSYGIILGITQLNFFQ